MFFLLDDIDQISACREIIVQYTILSYLIFSFFINFTN